MATSSEEEAESMLEESKSNENSNEEYLAPLPDNPITLDQEEEKMTDNPNDKMI